MAFLKNYFEFLYSHQRISHPKWELSKKFWENEKITVNARDNINTLVSWFHSLILQTYVYRLEKISSRLFDQIFCGMGRIPNVFIPFSSMEIVFSPFIEKFLQFSGIEYLNRLC